MQPPSRIKLFQPTQRLSRSLRPFYKYRLIVAWRQYGMDVRSAVAKMIFTIFKVSYLAI